MLYKQFQCIQIFYFIKKKKFNINMSFIQCNSNKHKFNIHMDSLRYIYVVVIIQMVTFSWFLEGCNKRPKYGDSCKYQERRGNRWRTRSCRVGEVYSGSSCDCEIDCKCTASKYIFSREIPDFIKLLVL